eukprot:121544_1
MNKNPPNKRMHASKQQELTEDQFQISRHLMVMGFGDTISLDAVHRYGTNIQQCVNFITDEQEHAEEEKKQKEPKTHMEEINYTATAAEKEEKAKYKQRLDALLLEVEHQLKQQQNAYDIYELVDRQYANRNGIDGFIEDYGEYATNIDSIYPECVNECELAICPYIKREYRDRSIYDTDEKERFELYSHCNESERSVIIQQFVDQIHINKYHLTDLGLKYVKDHEDINDGQHDNAYNRPIYNEVVQDGYNLVMAKRDGFVKLTNDSGKLNRFVTPVLNYDGDEDDDDSKENSYSPYSFGVRFYYHDYYKNNDTKWEIVPGNKDAYDYGNRHINASYSYASWFVSPKHETMKDEVLNAADGHNLTIIQYQNTVMKAIIKHKVLKGTVKGASDIWKEIYGISKRSLITAKHILSVLLYTNHPDLTAAFSQSFRKLSGSESDHDFKERHSYFANWARMLRETVECWGYGLWERRKSRQTFYHGISKTMVLDGFKQRFCCLTSTTLQYETAMMSVFANQREGDEEGTVISIRNDGSKVSFFDCIRWSDCNGESEMLFLGGFDPLDVCGLTVLDNRLNMRYFNWITAMKVFRTGLTDGDVTTDKVRAVTVKHIDLLVDNLLNKRKANDIPAYIQTLFEEILSKIPRIIIDIGRMNEVICYTKGDGTVCYGYKRLKHLYFDDKNEIKWNVWRQLYPGLERIDIHSVVKIPSEENGVQFEYRESIFVDDVLMLGILSFLKQTKIKKIEIFYPSNSMDSLNKLVKTYCGSFEEIDYRLDVDDTYCHEDWGSCTVFTCLLF